jgi:hypothetical protein
MKQRHLNRRLAVDLQCDEVPGTCRTKHYLQEPSPEQVHNSGHDSDSTQDQPQLSPLIVALDDGPLHSGTAGLQLLLLLQL